MKLFWNAFILILHLILMGFVALFCFAIQELWIAAIYIGFYSMLALCTLEYIDKN